MKFETVRIHFLRDDLICCHLEICFHGNVTYEKIEGKRPLQRPK